MSKSIVDKFRRIPLAKLVQAGARITHPSVLRILVEDGVGRQDRAGSSRRHLDATIDWLRHAQDRAGGAGVSAGFSF
ncbi:MAG TPA: hypothetical protein VJ302_35855, partial [Blastocatellia bacterium]|nr:hypothetical protein [Blastocatellia bacterium]